MMVLKEVSSVKHMEPDLFERERPDEGLISAGGLWVKEGFKKCPKKKK